jgi:hypothetical protein
MRHKGISATIIVLAIIVLLGLILASDSFKNFVPSTTTTTRQCGGWPGALLEPYTLRIGGQRENYTVGEIVTIDLYVKNNHRCEGGQWVNRSLTLNTLSFSVDVERLITTQIPYTVEPVLLTNVLKESTGPITIPTGTEIEVGQWAWRQTDSQGRRVGEGTYQITFHSLDSNITSGILTFITIGSQ